MLYVSTRNPVDSFTAHRALRQERTPDGGLFVPMRFPLFSEEDLAVFSRSSFGETAAYVLNLFFSAELTGWDIDSCAGRHPYKLIHMSHKLLISELWHNQKMDYEYLQKRIYQKLLVENNTLAEPTLWAKIAIGISVLCGIWGESLSSQQEALDIAVSTKETSMCLALYFAKKMGLPIGNLIFSSEDDGALWDFLNHAETNCPENDIQPMIELMIYDLLGREEATVFADRSSQNKSYRLSEENAGLLPKQMYASVIGHNRINSLRSSIYRSCGYVADRNVALSFGGLQNYRAQTGCSKTTLLLEMHNPAQHDSGISNLLGVSQDELNHIIRNI